MSNKVREAFEAWTVGAGGHPSVLRRNAGGDYALGSVRAEYAVWQASRAAALEEAAVECERISADSKHYGYGTEAAAEQGCADAIRDLAGRGA